MGGVSSKKLAIENLGSTALMIFRKLVEENKNLQKDWQEAVLSDTQDGFPEALSNTVSVGKEQG